MDKVDVSQFDISNFDLNAILRGAQLTLVGVNRALQNPGLFTSDHYRQAVIAVVAGIAIRVIVAIPVVGVRVLLWILSLFVNMDHTHLDESVVNGLHFLEHTVLQVPFFLMTMMRYVTPTLDQMFMDSLRWVDETYVQKHKTEDPHNLRAMYYPNLEKYPEHAPKPEKEKKLPIRQAVMIYTMKQGRKAAISLGVLALSYAPYVGRFVLPAASFYTFKKSVGTQPAAAIFAGSLFFPRRYLVSFLQAYFSSRTLMRELLEPYFARVRYTPEQKKLWFKDRAGVLFGFGLGFYIFVKIPLVGVLIYGLAEASTAYLITKITEPPLPPAEADKFKEESLRWKNKHEFLNLPWQHMDEHNLAMHKPPVQSENRWHPENPSYGTIKPGEAVKIECVDWTGGQIGNNDSADDVRDVDLTKIHYLTGPFDIETAEPGDVLLVEIQDVQPLDEQPWGFTGIFAKENGGGFLDEIYPEPAKAIWDFEGIFCSSRHIPGVRFAGLIHPGILGCAPSAEVLETWNTREAELITTHTHLNRTVAEPPQPTNVHAGSAPSDLLSKIGKEGARTIPGRPEHGGNCDIKNLSRGSKVYLPVHVPGAKFSVGDLHFSQGDGEISFCGAIEMAGVITLKFSVMKGGMKQLDMKSPIYIPGPVEPQFGSGRYIYFEGFSVDEKGKQWYLDATVAYRQSCLRVVEYLRRFGYNDYQIYLLLSCAPIQGHIAGIVDIPNACTTIGLPMDIFDFDIAPHVVPEKKQLGACAFAGKK
ncbi:hypothetical protein PTNB73_04297 [Pyrenophora teres f. teres]|nr:hypothetical protein PTNB85_05029 [Pyrenophora teres f. teres]KAE8839886.1 hypothetical protein HRS9122_06491 [Pyrenophora teres f. teres]KAE8862517.1 hypothetical protein PTNB29_05079 [Pyrenophora teres f. teres]KAE8869244.1 hypothetical protein PTNB73_04297 [Pyrenophora teres f. teres]